MPTGIVKLKGKWYVLITTYDVHHRGEAEEIVAHKLENKHFPVRVFPFKSWGEAVVYGNALTDEFLDDWSMRDYVMKQPESIRHKIIRHMVEGSIEKEERKKPERPEWKDKLATVKGKPSVKVIVKKKRRIEK